MEGPGTMKIVVIGAGMGGMTAAGRLARAGHSVSVYEACDTVGGKWTEKLFLQSLFSIFC